MDRDVEMDMDLLPDDIDFVEGKFNDDKFANPQGNDNAVVAGVIPQGFRSMWAATKVEMHVERTGHLFVGSVVYKNLQEGPWDNQIGFYLCDIRLDCPYGSIWYSWIVATNPQGHDHFPPWELLEEWLMSSNWTGSLSINAVC